MNLRKNLISAAASLLGALALTGCVADDLDMNECGTGAPTSPSLVFDLKLPSYSGDTGGSSSSYAKEYDHGEEWETYIEQSKFRVLFFDLHGNYLFEVDPSFITLYAKGEMYDENHTPYDAYRVSLPFDYLFPEDREQPLKQEVEDAVLRDGFKVAVLANWPHFVETSRNTDYTDDELLDGELMEMDFEFVYDPNHQNPKSKLEHLSHCIVDNVYGVSTANEAFRHVVGGPEKDMMGAYSSWVSYLYTSQRDAEDFIRAGQDHRGSTQIEGDVFFTFGDNTGAGPSGWNSFQEGNPDSYQYRPYSYLRKIDDENEYTLENVWRLWNFSAGAEGICPYKTLDPQYGRTLNPEVTRYWHNRNTYDLINELEKINWTSGNSFNIKSNTGESMLSTANKGCRYVSVGADGVSGGYMALPNVIAKADIDYIFANGTSPAASQTRITNFKNSAILFPAYGEGLIRIRAKATTSGAKIAVLTTNPDESAPVFANVYGSIDGQKEGVITDAFYMEFEEVGELQTAEFLIDPSSKTFKNVYLAAVDGEVEIYEVEYMRARHIYDSARNAKMPSVTDPIPMYGVQNFAPIGDFLTSDHTFNMSDRSENAYLPAEKLDRYPFKFVYLLRSVAKVELRFKASVFRNNLPTHVMMRVMNRTARCEPMDVINPTEWLWYGYGTDAANRNLFTGGYNSIPDAADPASFVGIDKEFRNIKEYGPLHGRGTTSAEYRNVTSWFYGNWTMGSSSPDNDIYFRTTPWDFNGQATLGDNTLPFPRIFNSRIDRSDYCRFHHVHNKVINGEEYITYIMYVPEKNIDDGDIKGSLTARPKVQHMEVRFDKMNDVVNFDDSDCYWIYFTDYSENNGKLRSYYRDGSDRNNGIYTYDDAEMYDQEFLNLLQPIVRNCHYIFTITSINDEHIGVNLSICGAAGRSTTFNIN